MRAAARVCKVERDGTAGFYGQGRVPLAVQVEEVIAQRHSYSPGGLHRLGRRLRRLRRQLSTWDGGDDRRRRRRGAWSGGRAGSACDRVPGRNRAMKYLRAHLMLDGVGAKDASLHLDLVAHFVDRFLRVMLFSERAIDASRDGNDVL